VPELDREHVIGLLTADDRYLVDEGFLSRDHGEYWRSAGTVETP
jgi:hypothetical protein